MISERASIDYSPIDHLFAVTIDGREIGRAVSHDLAVTLRDQYFRAEQALRQVVFPEGRMVLTVSQAAKALGMSRITVMELIDQGDIKAFQVGERTVQVSVRAIEEWIAQEEKRFQISRQPDLQILARRKYNSAQPKGGS